MEENSYFQTKEVSLRGQSPLGDGPESGPEGVPVHLVAVQLFCQHLGRQDCEYNVSSLCVSLFGNLLLIFSPISSQGPTFMAQSSWNLMNASSLSLASVMMLDPVQATPPTAELTASTAPARIPLLVVVGRPGRLVGGLLLGGPLGPPGRLGGGLCSGL